MRKIDLLRQEVFDANLELVRRGLVVQAFGNVSAIDRDAGYVVIKPSGVPYDSLTPANLALVDMEGRLLEGELKPSSDLPTHLALYRAFTAIGGIAHTHSRYATVWAQAGREIPCLGTTHADYFRGPVPVTEPMTPAEIRSSYEWNTGQAIVRRFSQLDPMELPAVLVNGHGPFCWGTSASAASNLAVLLEEVAAMALGTLAINPSASPISPVLRDRHFLRKHGPAAYYGQK